MRNSRELIEYYKDLTNGYTGYYWFKQGYGFVTKEYREVPNSAIYIVAIPWELGIDLAKVDQIEDMLMRR